MILKATSTLSVIRRPGTKTLWFSEIMVERIGLSLLVRTFDMILLDTLHRLISRNSLILDGQFVFGMRAILVWFRAAIDAFEFRTFSTILITLSQMTSQYFW